ncbi:MAG TPA: hypothetical protein PLX21_12465, partial [Rhodocyclaceae bacterium]|nr:hypothetical protein [Rhodocyclaceae bacterium]
RIVSHISNILPTLPHRVRGVPQPSFQHIPEVPDLTQHIPTLHHTFPGVRHTVPDLPDDLIYPY